MTVCYQQYLTRLWNITGHYVLVITLSDGDEYEGEFDVTE